MNNVYSHLFPPQWYVGTVCLMCLSHKTVKLSLEIPSLVVPTLTSTLPSL
jgi:hypothetical protein